MLQKADKAAGKSAANQYKPPPPAPNRNGLDWSAQNKWMKSRPPPKTFEDKSSDDDAARSAIRRRERIPSPGVRKILAAAQSNPYAQPKVVRKLKVKTDLGVFRKIIMTSISPI